MLFQQIHSTKVSSNYKNVPICCQSQKIAAQFAKKQNIQPVIGHDHISLKEKLYMMQKNKNDIQLQNNQTAKQTDIQKAKKDQNKKYMIYLNNRSPKTNIYRQQAIYPKRDEY